MKIALITDIHFGARNDSPIIDRNYDKFYTNVFFPTLKKRNIKNVSILGDTFDKRKNVNFNTLETCRRYFFDPLRYGDFKVMMLVGNHDSYFKNTIKVNSPNLLILDYDNITVIESPTVFGNILYMPWICDENQEDSYELLQNANVDIVMGHFEIAGFCMSKGNPQEHGMKREIFKRFKKVFSGHYHHRSTIGNITYLGNPSELTWVDYDDPRGFHIFDTETFELEFIQNPYTLFSKIVYDEDDIDMTSLDQYKDKYIKLYIHKRTDYNKFDFYLNGLMDVGPVEVKVIDEPLIQDVNVDSEEISMEDTLSLTSQYIESMEVDLDKTRLFNMMKQLYTESLEVE